jgi:hypothetical protein
MVAIHVGRRKPAVNMVNAMSTKTEALLYQGLINIGLGELILKMIFASYTYVTAQPAGLQG